MSKLTDPQTNVLTFVQTHGKATKEALTAQKLDIRAANNLVKQGVLVYENGFYLDPTQSETHPGGPLHQEPEAPTELPDWAKSKEPYTGSAAAARARALQVAPTTHVAPVVKTHKHCLCGCGEQVKGSFKQGHDMRLHSAVARGGGAFVATAEQAAWLGGKAWAKGKYMVAK